MNLKCLHKRVRDRSQTLRGEGGWCIKFAVRKIVRAPFWTAKFLRATFSPNPTEHNIDSIFSGIYMNFLFSGPLLRPQKFQKTTTATTTKYPKNGLPFWTGCQITDFFVNLVCLFVFCRQKKRIHQGSGWQLQKILIKKKKKKRNSVEICEKKNKTKQNKTKKKQTKTQKQHNNKNKTKQNKKRCWGPMEPPPWSFLWS